MIEPIVVKTVSYLKVSDDNFNFASVLVIKLSFLQAVKIVVIMKMNDIERMYFFKLISFKIRREDGKAFFV